jgi:hypothetical protein
VDKGKGMKYHSGPVSMEVPSGELVAEPSVRAHHCLTQVWRPRLWIVMNCTRTLSLMNSCRSIVSGIR